MIKYLMLIFLLLFTGCVNFNYDTESYKEGEQINLQGVNYRFDFIRGDYSIKGDSIYITDIVRYLQDKVCVVYSSDLKDVEFSIEIENSSLAEMMRAISVAIDASVQHMGRLWVFTRNEKKENVNSLNSTSSSIIEYTYFFNVIGYSEKEVIENLSMFQVKKIGNSFYCFRGSLMDAISLDDVLGEMIINQPVQYFFTVWFISEDILRDLSIKISSKVNLDVRKILGDMADESKWSLVFDVIGDSSFDVSNTDQVRKISGVVREGGEFLFNVGDEIPIPRRSVSDSGTVTDTGYEYQQTGLVLRLKCEGKSRGVLELDLENTDISGYVGNLPIKHGSRLQTVLIVSDDKRSYVGSCQMTSKTRGLFGWNARSNKYHVFLQCDLVGVGQRVSTNIDKY